MQCLYSSENPIQLEFTKRLVAYLGIPYVWGGQSKGAVDCSGLIIQSLRDMGFSIKDRTAGGIFFDLCIEGPSSPGLYPLVFLYPHAEPAATRDNITHVAAYLASNVVIQATEAKGNVHLISGDDFVANYGHAWVKGYLDFKGLATYYRPSAV
jgi:lipoprotein Spr